jgi:hypothetical protein
MPQVIYPGQLNTNGAYLVSEARGYRAREQVTIAADAGVLKGGTILGKRTATGEYVAFTAGAADGSQTAAAILWEEVITTGAAVQRAAHVRDCEVTRAELFFAGTPTTPQKNAAYASLAALGIIMR